MQGDELLKAGLFWNKLQTLDTKSLQMFDSCERWFAERRQKNILKEFLFCFLIQMDTWALLSSQNIHLLTSFVLVFTTRFICVIVLLLHVFILPTIHLCIRAKNRSSEISGVVKLPEELKADFGNWFIQSVCMSRKTSSRSAEMHLCGRKRAALGAIRILGESCSCSDQLLG